MQNLVEKLNTPFIVVAVLAVILLANGFLLYQSRSSSPDSSREQAAGQAAVQAGERDEDRGGRGSQGDSGGNAASGGFDNEATTTAAGRTDEQSEQSRTSGPDTTPEEEQESADGADRETEESTREDGSGERGSGGDGEESEDAGSQVGDADLLAGLSSSVSSCEESPDEQCIRDFVVQVAPESRYVGGRVDLSPQDDETNTEVIYFEDPGLESCEFERAEHEAEGRRYAVILLGEGSFSDERGDQCIPQV